MASGISDAKARRNSKTKASFKSRAKAGLPAKAGKRRPHNIKHDKDGNYIAADFKPRPKVDYDHQFKGYVMREMRNEHITPVPSGRVLSEGMDKIWQLERRAGLFSDPFVFARMRTHFRHGLLEL